MENFRKYYKFPLKVDDMGVYIRTTDYEMALMFTVGLNDDTIHNIVDKLNGESNKSVAYPLWHMAAPFPATVCIPAFSAFRRTR